MAKTIPFNKLNLKRADNVTYLLFGEDNLEIEVKQYLPINDKIEIITNVLELSADENNFANPVKVEVYFNLELIYKYTNLAFTDKQKEDPTKLYDILESNDFFNAVMGLIPENEYNLLWSWTKETIDNYYKQRNSALGVLEAASADYQNLNIDAEELNNKIANPANLKLLKDISTKLG